MPIVFTMDAKDGVTQKKCAFMASHNVKSATKARFPFTSKIHIQLHSTSMMKRGILDSLRLALMRKIKS